METNQANIFRVEPATGDSAPAPDSILSQSLLQNPDVKVVRFAFAKGQELSEHTAAVAAMIHQVSGRAQWGLAGETRTATPGDWAYMPPNLKHSIVAVEDCVVLLLLLKKTAG